MELRTFYFSNPESIRWLGGDDYVGGVPSMSSLGVVIGGFPGKVKRSHIIRGQEEDVVKEFKNKKNGTPPAISSVRSGPVEEQGKHNN